MEDIEYLIIGAGVWGLSTAWHLIKSNPQSKIVCIDRWQVPSIDSAGYDINKVISAKYGSDLDNYISLLAFEKWEDPIFENVYHKTGMFGLADDNPEAMEYVTKAYNVRKQKNYGENVKWCSKPGDILEHCRYLKGAQLDGWEGYYDKLGGWAHSSKAMTIVYEECLKLGVNFIFGSPGSLKKLLFNKGEVSGVLCDDGSILSAKQIILCMGSYTDIFLDLEGQAVAKAWSVVHVKVTEEEAERMRNSPVLFNFQRGFFFEPDENLNVKIVNEFPGFTHYQKLEDGRTISVPISNGFFPQNTIPDSCRLEVRDFLRRVLPFLADREFVFEKLCWCSDSNDKRWIITKHPKFKNLTIATGDSGLGFKMLPVIGDFIQKVSKGIKLPDIVGTTWDWKDQSEYLPKKLERWGMDSTVKDLKNEAGWKKSV